MKIAFFECLSGISGDMILGALADIGLDLDYLKDELKKLDLSGYKLSSKKVNRCGIGGTKVDVLIDAENGKHNACHRTIDTICNLINKSKLSSEVKESSIAVFRRIADAESKVHRVKPEDIHFHEIGAIDSIIDIVGAIIGFKKLEFSEIYFSGVATGCGYVKCAHGKLPVPAPATAELLKGYVLSKTNIDSELTTPTGAAILTTIGKQIKCLPDFRLTNIGYGAGYKDFAELPNLLRVFVGNLESESPDNKQIDEMWMVETNIDDMSGEIFGYVIEKLLDAGAVDAYMTPIQTKKSRPSTLLSAIVPENRLPCVESAIFDQTTTFGIRKYKVHRSKLTCEIIRVTTEYGNVRVKIGKFNGNVKNIKPEYEDCKKIADKKGISLKAVYNATLKTSL